MPGILKEVDQVVLMPRCARHALAGNTFGMKAAVSYWRTVSRLEGLGDTVPEKVKIGLARRLGKPEYR